MGETNEEPKEEARDGREDLINNICMYMMSCGIDTQDAKSRLYILTEPYEIMTRCTALAEMNENRNEYLLKQFILGKTVAGRSKKTIHAYIQTLKKALGTMNKTVDDITTEDVRFYLAIRQQRDHISKRYADTERRYLSSFFTYLTNEEYIRRNPMLKVDKIKYTKAKKKAFTDMEIEQLRASARDEREKMMIEVLLSTGCRVDEFIQIRIDEIDGNRIIVHGKGAKDRYVYLNAKAELAIKIYLKERKDTNPYLMAGGREHFVSTIPKGYKQSELRTWWKFPERCSTDTHIGTSVIECTMRSLAKIAGVEEAHPHKFRRTCATLALRRGMPIEQVSKMLGHEELTTTQIYLDLSEDELAQAHKKYVV